MIALKIGRYLIILLCVLSSLAQGCESASGDSDLKARSLEMAKLAAQITQEYSAYQKRPRHMFIGKGNQDPSIARYVEDLHIKMERVGNLYYPEAARAQKLYGKVQLTVSIKADGRLDKVEVTHSSGSKILDAAAEANVVRAAPYSPFPDDIRTKADILIITRTWNFMPDGADQIKSHFLNKEPVPHPYGIDDGR